MVNAIHFPDAGIFTLAESELRWVSHAKNQKIVVFLKDIPVPGIAGNWRNGARRHSRLRRMTVLDSYADCTEISVQSADPMNRNFSFPPVSAPQERGERSGQE